MNIELKDRKAIITRSTVEGLARAGASVIINGRGRPTGLEEIGPRTSRTAIGRLLPVATLLSVSTPSRQLRTAGMSDETLIVNV